MDKILPLIKKYKFQVIGIVGLIVVFLVMRGRGGDTTTVIEGTQTFSEDYLLQSQAQANALESQVIDIQGSLSMQSLVNSGQLDLVNVERDIAYYTSDTNLAIATIQSDAAKVIASYDLQGIQARSNADVSIAGVNANALIKQSEYSYLLGVDTNDAQMYVSDNNVKVADLQAKAAKSIAKVQAWGGALGSIASGIGMNIGTQNMGRW
jgi:hypothetical protein